MKLLLLFINVLIVHSENHVKYPTIQIITLFRNKGHTLPYFFTYLEKLNYPKDRISLWFRSDHNEDNTIEIVNTWLLEISAKYHHVDFKYTTSEKLRQTEQSPLHWPTERHLDVIRLKEEGLYVGRKNWADYIFFLDADTFLTLPNTLEYLINMNLPIVSPMLLSDGLYSNFWAGMSENFYYERTDEYKEIYNYDKNGEFKVPMIHSAVLVNLRDTRSDNLTFNKTKLLDKYLNEKNNLLNLPIDDIIIFAISANLSNTPMYISNSNQYGYIMVPLDQEDNLAKDFNQLINVQIFIVNDERRDDDATVTNELKKYVQYPNMDKMTLTKIYMINLERRTKRKEKMVQSFKVLGLDVEHFVAVDGEKLTDEYLDEIGVQFLPNYADPYHNRPMTMGEIGCFLSHYNIWKEMIEFNLTEVLILEDDIRFEPYFKESSIHILNEARMIGEWNLIYFGRKRLEDQVENWVYDSEQLVHAGYSYWTLGYVLNLEGARKLIDAKPLKKLLPVDEFLPIMFNKHLNNTWKSYFPNKNLIAWSAAPLLLFPTHYTGEEGYISDTEDSIIIKLEDDEQKEKKGDKENIILKDNNSSFEEEKRNSKLKTNYILSVTADKKVVHTEL